MKASDIKSTEVFPILRALLAQRSKTGAALLQIKAEEVAILRSQMVTESCGYNYCSYALYAQSSIARWET